MANIEINIGDLCTHCGRDTSSDSEESLFVNRLPSGADGTLTLAGGFVVDIEVTINGYMCVDCQNSHNRRRILKVLDYNIDDGQIICTDCEEVNQGE
tara:strand:+ start:55 stop:345 length:291 start_codon:yes stop_codon:yes gene_type:complete